MFSRIGCCIEYEELSTEQSTIQAYRASGKE